MSGPVPVPEVDVTEARQRADAGAVVLDVREPDEWEAGHAEGAAWIPMGEVAARAGELPSDRTIVVVCRVGSRSARVTSALLRAGYDAVNLAGGMKAWASSGHPVVTDTGAPGSIV